MDFDITLQRQQFVAAGIGEIDLMQFEIQGIHRAQAKDVHVPRHFIGFNQSHG